MGKKTPMEMVLICAASFLSLVLVYKFGIFVHEMVQSGLKSWEETPRSTKYLYYGLGVAIANAAIVFGIGTTFKDNIHEWIAATKIIWTLLICLMCFFWMAAIFFGFLEKIGALR